MQNKVIRILNTKCEYAFSKYPLPFVNAQRISLKQGLESFRCASPSDMIKRSRIFHIATSTISSIALAIHMGFKQIGVIGFDLTGHSMAKHAEGINRNTDIIQESSHELGVEILNLSKDSMIESFNKCTIEEFDNWYGGNNA